MTDISPFIKNHLLEPLKNYPTVIQDTMIEIITQRLQELYDLTVEFPEILSPNQYRLDILKTIADQFLFTVRDDADIQEQLEILENILYIYRRRGSIDTIENMWMYYGGELPKDIKVIVPFDKVFRYSRSKLSGTHSFLSGSSSYVVLDTPAPIDVDSGILISEKGSTRRRVTTGVLKGSNRVSLTTVDGLSLGSVLDIGGIYEGIIQDIYNPPEANSSMYSAYEIRLTNNTYSIPDLKQFLIKELVAAGTYIYFTNSLHMDISESDLSSNYYKYLVAREDVIDIQLDVPRSYQGFRWSTNSTLSGEKSPRDNITNEYIPDLNRLMRGGYYSGRQEIFVDITNMIEADITDVLEYLVQDISIAVSKLGVIEETKVGDLTITTTAVREVLSKPIRSDSISIDSLVSCTAENPLIYISNNFIDDNGNILPTSNYPGYFVLGETPLGKEVI